MQAIQAKSLGAILLAALGGLLVAFALTLTWPGHALAQEGEEPVEFVGAPPNSVDIDENTLGEIGRYLARATDGNPLVYSLTGPDADDFYISNLEEDAGTIYNNRAFDFEDADDKSLSLRVNATSSSLGHTATLDVTVTVQDKNDRPSFGAHAFDCSLGETDRSGSPCFENTIQRSAGRSFACATAHNDACLASDDDGDRLTYSLADGWRMAEYLDIDPATGAVTLSDYGAGRLDFEGRPEFTVGIRVSDGKDVDSNPDTETDDRAVVRVVVQDVVFEPPRLSSVLAWPKSESMRVVWTTDMATAQRYRVRYRATGDRDWTEHDLTGTLRQGFGYVYSPIGGLYADTQYALVYCHGADCDADSWTFKSGSTLRTAAEPNAPAVISRTSDMSIAEDAGPSDVRENLIGWVYGHAGRGDRYGQNELRYWLEGDGAENFTVERFRNSDYGIIRAAAALDHETAASYTLTVHISDGRSATGAKDLSSDDSAEITISVADVLEPPDSPLLTLGAKSPTTVQLRWDTPEAGDQVITGYHVQYREAGSSRWHHSDLLTGTQAFIERLRPDIAYEFRGITVAKRYKPTTWSDRDTAPTLTVRTEPGTAQQIASETGSAQRSSGSSEAAQDRTTETGPNSAATERTTIPAGPPSAPQNLSAAATAGSVALTWDAPDDKSITGYQVLRKQFGCGCALEVHVDNTASATTAFTDTAVEPGTGYVYRVKAINAAGVSDQSNYVRVATE